MRMANMYFPRHTSTTIGAMTFATIQQGSTGPDVVAWQKILGIKADGIFGPQTKQATINYQSAHGLAVDGIVGPQTWGTASAKALEASVGTSRALVVAGAAGAAGLALWALKKHKHKRAA